MGDASQSIVLDIGCSQTRAGFGGQDTPKVVFPTVVGHERHSDGMVELTGQESYVGVAAETRRSVLLLKRPVKESGVENWDDYERVVHHTFEQLKTSAPETKVLYSVPVMGSKANEQKMSQLLFESYNVPVLAAAYAPVMSLYGAGKSSGVVVEIGEGSTQIMPIWEGAMIGEAVKKTRIGGEMLTNWFSRVLTESVKGMVDPTQSMLLDVRLLKQQSCYVAQNYEKELKEFEESKNALRRLTCSLVDGSKLTLGSERIRVGEALFTPSLLGIDALPLDQLVRDAFKRSPLDIRQHLAQNIILSGGTTLMTGLEERLEAELNKGGKKEARVLALPNRLHLTWIGGSRLASHDSFQGNWLTKQQYEEIGPSAIHQTSLQSLWG